MSTKDEVVVNPVVSSSGHSYPSSVSPIPSGSGSSKSHGIMMRIGSDHHHQQQQIINQLQQAVPGHNPVVVFTSCRDRNSKLNVPSPKPSSSSVSPVPHYNSNAKSLATSQQYEPQQPVVVGITTPLTVTGKVSKHSSNSNGGQGTSFTFGRFNLRSLLDPLALTRSMARTPGLSSRKSKGTSDSNGASGGTSSDHGNKVGQGTASSTKGSSAVFCQYSSFDLDTNSISSNSKGHNQNTNPIYGTTESSDNGTSSGHNNQSNSGQAHFGPVNKLLYSSLRRKSTSSSNGSSTMAPCPSTSKADFKGTDSTVIECPLCLLELPPECYPSLYLTCPHRACYDCLQQYLRIEISESRINISCPECPDQMHPNDIRMILNDENFTSKYEKFMIRRVLCAEPDARWCPAPDCGYVVIASGCAGCPKLTCSRPGCNTNFCYHCKQEWHPNQTCDAARAIRHRNNPGSDPRRGSYSHSTIDPVTGQVRDPDIKPCPICKVLIIKMDDGSCNHMTCSVCGTEFCWLCMKQISDLHYLSPSGCTFWGKKPWSRKKKIFWQLGMLVGAPVGIALIAGIAVPAIIIGIPVWVGRRLHAKLEKRSVSKKKRNIIVAGGVISSVAVSPILATVAVGIGVPILLAYVYGVVPISLCRSGGCGVDPENGGSSSGDNDGIRIEMDDETDHGLSINNGIGTNSMTTAPDRLSLDTALSNKVNPSIGEVSLVMSMSVSLGSGSNLDGGVGRSGVIHSRDNSCNREIDYDRDLESLSLNPSLNPSNVPLAGSIASVTTTPIPTAQDCVSSDGLSDNGQNNLLNATAVSSSKRHSFSSHNSESISGSNCGTSINGQNFVATNVTSSDDAASTRALAGSVCSRASSKSSKNSKHFL